MVERKKRKLSIPSFSSTRITVCDGRRVIMEGVRDILSYSTEKMVLQGPCRLEVAGKGLELMELGGDVVEIRGALSDLSFGGWRE